ncbi:MAG TPA: hypothetical protein VK631_17585, partial [Solirubrobacteraceae bacterium]|nr:hypothetical protein [Solirubrobacteraceae bacterium]
MEIAKALILAGRTAHDRPWPSVRSGPKHLVPVANRPIVQVSASARSIFREHNPEVAFLTLTF